MTRDDFLTAAWPLAQLASMATGLDARLVMAQTILETGWGEHAPENDYFGIKGRGGTYITTEYETGVLVHVAQPFAAYPTMADAFRGYAQLMLGMRYASVRAAVGLDAQIAALGRSGYATDPAYASKVSQIAGQLTVPA